jgi:hypothetical protein
MRGRSQPRERPSWLVIAVVVVLVVAFLIRRVSAGF